MLLSGWDNNGRNDDYGNRGGRGGGGGGYGGYGGYGGRGNDDNYGRSGGWGNNNRGNNNRGGNDYGYGGLSHFLFLFCIVIWFANTKTKQNKTIVLYLW